MYKVIAPQGTNRLRQPFPKVDYLFRYPAMKETPEGWMTWQEHPIDERYFALFHYDATKMILRDGHIYWYTAEERKALENGAKIGELEGELSRLKAESKEFSQAIGTLAVDKDGPIPIFSFSPGGVEEVLDKDSIRDTRRRPRPYDPEDLRTSTPKVEPKPEQHPVEEKKLVNERINVNWLRKSVYRRYHIGDSELLEVTEVYFCGIRYIYRSDKRIKGLKEPLKNLY